NPLATQVLAGANTYTGTTTVNSSTLKMGAVNTLPSTTALTVNGNTATTNSILDLAGFAQNVASLAGTNTQSVAFIQNSQTASTGVLTVSGSASTQFDGLIRDNGG